MCKEGAWCAYLTAANPTSWITLCRNSSYGRQCTPETMSVYHYDNTYRPCHHILVHSTPSPHPFPKLPYNSHRPSSFPPTQPTQRPLTLVYPRTTLVHPTSVSPISLLCTTLPIQHPLAAIITPPSSPRTPVIHVLHPRPWSRSVLQCGGMRGVMLWVVCAWVVANAPPPPRNVCTCGVLTADPWGEREG